MFNEWRGDPEIQETLDWILSFIHPKKWALKKKQIKEYLLNISTKKPDPTPLTVDTPKTLYPDDKFAWYLYLADSYNNHIEDYEFYQGARVIPIFKIIGANIELVKSLGGIETLVKKMINKQKTDPDGTLFELLIGLLYKRNSWAHVDFLPEIKSSKSPDMHIRNERDEFFIECKRLSKSSTYSTKETEHWLNISQPLRDYLASDRIPMIIDIVFHKELSTLDTTLMENQLIPKIRFVGSKGVLIDNENWTITVDFVDFSRINEHMAKYSVKIPSSSLIELIFKSYDSFRGYYPIVLGRPSITRQGYLDSIGFASGIVWNCDAQEAIDKKSRSIILQLSEAASQLPPGVPGIIHVGLESHDGPLVEDERFKKIVSNTIFFNSKNKSLDWIYCHIFDPKVPPDDNWDFGETVIPFSSERAAKEPLKHRSAVLPHYARSWDGVFW